MVQSRPTKPPRPLRGLPAFAGSSAANNTNQNTAGGSQVQLRNRDTLVQVNGRRSAIDRLEVLEDGASGKVL